MDFSRASLTPGSKLLADQKDKARRVKEAEDAYQGILRDAERSSSAVPPYEFLELIGKGAFGRVYKCKDTRTGELVAVKMINAEDQDYAESANPENPRDQTIRDFQKEVSTLQQLKDSRAKNIMVIHDAFESHSHLWIVSNYCTGGSVRTLMRPLGGQHGRHAGLPERYIIPIARELAVAIKGIHEQNIIHRDIKCANIYITEDGSVQLGDYGIVGLIDDGVNAKRKTVIGTPHWMPLEMVERLNEGRTERGYGSEVDIWSYGCTIFEMATGAPPYPGVHPDDLYETIKNSPPRLEDRNYSPRLRDLISICLVNGARPTIDDILSHPALTHTEQEYPTESLIRLIELFKMWEHSGGSRQSLWIPSQADPVPQPDRDGTEEQVSDSTEADGWNFSTTDDFDKRISLLNFSDDFSRYLGSLHDAGPAETAPELPPLTTQGLSVAERIEREHMEKAENRGGKSLARLYDMNDTSGYSITPVTPTAVAETEPAQDLPLRNFTSDAPTRESMIEIDLDAADAGGSAVSTFMFEETIRPAGRKSTRDDDNDDVFRQEQQDESASKRNTMEWTFPTTQAPQPKRGTMDWTFSTAEPAQPDEPDFSMGLPPAGADNDLPPGFRPTLKHTTTEPVGHFRDFSHNMEPSAALSTRRGSTSSMIDLDLSMVGGTEPLSDPANIERPSTASSVAGSTMTDMTSGNPFDLEDDPIQNELDRKRFSYHKQWQSEGGPVNRHSHRTMQMHARGSSLSSQDSETVQQLAPGSDTMQPPPTMGYESGHEFGPMQDDTNQWPNFSSSHGFETSPENIATTNDIPRLGDMNYQLDQGMRSNDGSSSRPREQVNTAPSGPSIDFPVIRPPHPDALAEDADPQLLEAEFDRSLEAMAAGLDSVAAALRRYARIDVEESGTTSEEGGGSGFES